MQDALIKFVSGSDRVGLRPTIAPTVNHSQIRLSYQELPRCTPAREVAPSSHRRIAGGHDFTVISHDNCSTQRAHDGVFVAEIRKNVSCLVMHFDDSRALNLRYVPGPLRCIGRRRIAKREWMHKNLQRVVKRRWLIGGVPTERALLHAFNNKPFASLVVAKIAARIGHAID
jgi:hypothetical protein